MIDPIMRYIDNWPDALPLNRAPNSGILIYHSLRRCVGLRAVDQLPKRVNSTHIFFTIMEFIIVGKEVGGIADEGDVDFAVNVLVNYY